jgi:C4-dicarboxylate-specific signal transduction histidine kinase
MYAEPEAGLMTGDAVAATIVHEFKQPLSAMIADAYAGLSWLDRPIPDLDEAKAAFMHIAASGHRAGEMIGSIRAIFKPAAQSRVSLDLNEVITQALALVRVDLLRHGIRLQTELGGRNPRVAGDRIQLEQVLLNLITNAIDSMAAGDGPRALRVRIATEDNTNVTVSIADTGAGILPEDMERIFNPLFTTKSRGMGMGLSICRAIIEGHAGRLWVERNSPRGVVFRFVLRGEMATSAGQPPTRAIGTTLMPVSNDAA